MERHPANPANPFLTLEKMWAESVIQTFDFWRDIRDASVELGFFGIYGSPVMHRFGAAQAYQREQMDPESLAHLPEVEEILGRIDRGGYAVAVIRMLIVMAESRGAVRRDRLERSAKVLAKEEPFASLGGETRAALIREQTIVVEFALDRAIATLTDLLPDREDRQKAIDVVEFIVGSVEEMDPQSIQMLERIRAVLGLRGLALALEDAARKRVTWLRPSKKGRARKRALPFFDLSLASGLRPDLAPAVGRDFAGDGFAARRRNEQLAIAAARRSMRRILVGDARLRHFGVGGPRGQHQRGNGADGGGRLQDSPA